MGYKVDYEALQDICTIYNSSASSWNTQLGSVKDKQNVIMNSANIAGNSAAGMRKYMNNVYSVIDTSLKQLLSLFTANFLMYVAAYKQNVDGNYNAHIDENELHNIRSSIAGKRNTLGQLALRAENAVGGISNLVSLNSLDFDKEDAEIGDIITKIDNLDKAVNELESTYKVMGFDVIDDLIESTVTAIQNAYRLDINAKLNFTEKTLFTLPSMAALITSVKNANDYLSSNKEKIQAATDTFIDMMEERQKELEKREEQAEWVKIGAGILGGLIVAAVVVGTGGVGVAAILTGATIGFAKGAVNSAADEYAEHGWDDEWDTNRIMIDASISGITGTIESLIPPEANVIVSGIVNGVTGAIDTASEDMLDQIQTTGKISDAKSVIYDSAVSFVADFGGEIVENGISDRIFPDKAKDTLKNQIKKTGKGKLEYAARNTLSDTISGIPKRFVETGVEEAADFISDDSKEKTFGERVKKVALDAFDPKEIMSDAIKGGAKGGMKANAKDKSATSSRSAGK